MGNQYQQAVRNEATEIEGIAEKNRVELLQKVAEQAIKIKENQRESK